MRFLSRRYAVNRCPLAAQLLVLVMLVTLGAGPAAAQTEDLQPNDPAFTQLFPTGARVEKVAAGFGFVEGPLWIDRDGGYLLFSDIPGNRVHLLRPSGEVEILIDPVMAEGSPAGGVGGSNGLQLAPDGHVVLCEHGNRRVARLETDGTRTTVVDRFEGKRLNSPNDIVFRSTASAYFTDPSYGLPPQGKGKELDWNGVYRLDFSSPGKPRITLVSREMSNPNGIGLSPDGSTLYVANSSVTERHWIRFPVLEDGNLGPAKVHFDGSGIAAAGVPDGFVVDERGNLWASGPGGILVITPQGQHLGTVRFPELPANATFGGPQGTTLFVTARTGVYQIETTVRQADAGETTTGR